MEKLLSPKRLADLLGMAEQTIYNRHSTGGNLPPVIKLGRLLRFRLRDVEKWIEQQQKPTVVQPVKIDIPTIRHRGRPTKAEQVAARRKLL